jgi:glycosyltransferase 2 family protein
MRRAEDAGQPAPGQPAPGQPALGQPAAGLLAALRLPPSRYRNPGDVIGLIVAAGALAGALIAVRETGEPLFGLAAGLTAAAVTGGVAVLPWLRPWWRLAVWIVLLGGGTACLLTGTAEPAVLAAGAAAGLLAGFGVRVAAGVPDRRLGPDGIAAALSEAGLRVGPVRPAGVPAKGSRPYVAGAADGRELFIKALGRDQRQADLLYRAYRAVRLKGVGDRRPAASLRQAVEHQALAGMMAERAGVDVPPVHGVVVAPDGTALLVMDLVPGSSLDLVPAREITDDLLRRLWTGVARLHAAHLAHRSLRAANVMVEPSGRPWVVDFSFAELAASRRQMDLDVAELLASLALLVGPDRAVASAAEVIGTADLAAAVPLLQPLALSAGTRRELRAQKGLLTQTRSAAAARSGRGDEELAKIERVKPRTLLAVAAATGAFYILLPELLKASGSWQAVLNANWAWIPAVLAASVLTYVASAISLAGAVAIRLPFWPLLTTQFASSFINRISPANVGGMALNARFLQKSGVEPAAGATAVGVNALVGAVVHLALIAIFFTIAGRKLSGTFKLPSPSKILLILGIIAAVVGLILATRRARRIAARTILPRVRSALANLRDVARHPGKLILLVGGSALVTLAYIGALVMSVLAFRGPVSIAGIGAAYLAAAAIATASGTPGGVGTFEAVQTSLLTGIGIPASVAVPAVITYRLASYWLPVAPGWAAFRLLQRREYV